MSVYCVCALSIAADVRRNVELLRSGMCVHVCTTVPSMSNNLFHVTLHTASARVERFLELRSLFITCGHREHEYRIT